MSTKKECVAVEQSSQPFENVEKNKPLRPMGRKGKRGTANSVQKQSTGGLQCDYCKRKFRFLCRLNNHVAIAHTGERPHKCSVCHRTFLRVSSLKEHMLTHTGEKPHKCVLCQASFSLKRNLKRHMLSQH